MLCTIGIASPVQADSLAIDKVYHPYVQPLEREIEWRMISADGKKKHRFGIGKSLSDRLFVEAYMISSNNNNGLDALEIEAKWQLTEQGEYSADWGVVVELEKDRHENNWEFATGLISEKEWGRWVGTANLWAIYEWGETVENELESSLSLQARYRYSRYFEPAIEFYSGANTRGLGPVVMGDVKLKGQKKLHWEVGAIIGLDSKTPNNTWRLLTEFEF
ncbi:MAG: hypothetical protein GQ475_02560 [Methylococcaceae bacterium]|nr:hypothetical protein [Methylococcaceae bacterium]